MVRFVILKNGHGHGEESYSPEPHGMYVADVTNLFWAFYFWEDLRSIVELNRAQEWVVQILSGLLPWSHRR